MATSGKSSSSGGVFETAYPPPAFVYTGAGTPQAPEGAAGPIGGEPEEDTFEDVAGDPLPRRPPEPAAPAGGGRKRRRHGIAFWMVLGLLAVVAAGATGFVFWFARQASPPDAPGPEVTIEIPAGMDRGELVDKLADSGVITSAWAFNLYTKVNTPPEVKAGNYLFAAPSSFGDVYEVLRRPPVKKTFKVTFPEGFTVRQVTERVAAQVPDVTAAQFEQAMAAGKVRSKYMPAGAPSYEGFLFPDTYVFPEGAGADEVLEAMVTRFDEVADEVGIADVAGLAPYDVVKVASMVEKEARIDEDRAKISRVIFNRIEARMPLGIDATYLYALAPGTLPSDVNWKTNSPYNTRVRPGLPPTPVSNPGRASLEAAAHPEAGPWLYYVLTDEDGRHAFTTTLAEHNAAVADAKSRGVF